MAILNREEFFSSIQNRVGADTSDDAITFIENLTDTYNSLEKQARGDGVNWEQKYHELDESWKKKYSHRFFSGGCADYVPDNNTRDDDGEDDYNPESINFNNLFEERK